MAWSYYLMVLAHLAVFATAAPPAGGLDRALLSDSGRRRGAAILAGVALLAGVAGLITVWVDGGQTNLGWDRGQLTLMGFNVTGAVLVIIIGAVGSVALLIDQSMLFGLASAISGAGVIVTMVLWRRGDTNFLGADGRTMSFELMLAVGFAVLATRSEPRDEIASK